MLTCPSESDDGRKIAIKNAIAAVVRKFFIVILSGREWIERLLRVSSLCRSGVQSSKRKAEPHAIRTKGPTVFIA